MLEAPEIFINTGGRPTVPDLKGIDAVRYLTSTSMMDVDFLPEHLIVVGGSYIGLEFAQMYRRFGSRVTVVEMAPRIASREDPEVSTAIQTVLEGEGVAFGAQGRMRGGPAARAWRFTQAARTSRAEIAGSHLLLAVARSQHARPRPRQGGRCHQHARLYRGR
jgi:pyruvate/2-oxoglutarate dehydrogenase complex dihydrolipoamide dehydrogenase (E3) component